MKDWNVKKNCFYLKVTVDNIDMKNRVTFTKNSIIEMSAVAAA